uniref:Uncharacterized protein n=1 Tax=Oryza brachyantha TaxID=4533 RepID=J3M0B8_ORYBR
MAGGSPTPSKAGAPSSGRKRKAAASTAAATAAREDEAAEEEEEEEEDTEELERELDRLGRRLLDLPCCFATIADEVSLSMSSINDKVKRAKLVQKTKIQFLSVISVSDADSILYIADVTTGPQSLAGTPLAKADQEKLEKLKIIKAKSEANIAAMPVVLKSMNESIAQIEKLEHLNVNMHPVFKTKR